MGLSESKEKVRVSKAQYDAVCFEFRTHDAGAYLTYETAKQFFSQLCQSFELKAEADWIDQWSNCLFHAIDTKETGLITFPQLEALFFLPKPQLNSLGISLTESLVKELTAEQASADFVDSLCQSIQLKEKQKEEPTQPSAPETPSTPTPENVTKAVVEATFVRTPSGPPPPGAYRKVQGKLTQVAPPIWKLDHKTAKPKDLTQPISWDTCIGWTRSPDGTDGVFFFGFPGDEIVVCKGSDSVYPDLFANEIIGKLNIPCISIKPIVMVHDNPHSEYAKIYSTLEKFAIQENHMQHRKIRCHPVFELMPYVPGKPLKDFPLPTDNQDLMFEYLFNLGRMQVYDMLIRNTDRIPTFSQIVTGGNLGNIYITNEGQMLAIDQVASDPVAQSIQNEELRKIQQYLDELCDSDFNTDKVPKLEYATWLHKWVRERLVNVDIGVTGWEFGCLGAMIGICQITQCITEKVFDDALATMAVIEQNAKAAYGLRVVQDYGGLNQICCGYYKQVLGMFNRVKLKLAAKIETSKHQNLIKQAMRNYKIELPKNE